jgi:circadian clock protein KaiC
MSGSKSAVDEDSPRVPTGNDALDNILHGGVDPRQIYLVEGKPGTGKTTLALQFLLGGAARGERTLYVSLSETRRELNLVASRHGWSLDKIEIFELTPAEAALDPDKEMTVLHPAELELNETLQSVFNKVQELNPSRVIFDSLSEIRLLAQSPLRYRRQILALKHFFAGRKSTVILLDDLSSSPTDLQLHSIAHGVILLDQTAVDYGVERRRLRVVKMRGTDFRSGFHDFTIKKGGIEIYPRLIASEHHRDFVSDFVSSGNAQLDTLLGSGWRPGARHQRAPLGPRGCGKIDSRAALRRGGGEAR